MAVSRKPLTCLAVEVGELPAADVLYLESFLVAALPSTGLSKGSLAYAANGRAITGVGSLGGGFTLEATGAGSGCLVTWSGTAWRIAGTTTIVTA